MKKYRVIIVEDFEHWQEIIRDKLDIIFNDNKISSEIIIFNNYSDASRFLKYNHPIHLLITDISLGQPINSLGDELCKTAYRLGIPCIAISATPNVNSQHIRDLFKEYGVVDYFRKIEFRDDYFNKTIINEYQKAKNSYYISLKFYENDEQSEAVDHFLKNTNPNHLKDTLSLLNLLFPENLEQNSIIELFNSLKLLLDEINGQIKDIENKNIKGKFNQILNYLKKSELDIKHGLKFTLPIIPFIFSYEGSIQIGTKDKIFQIWNQLSRKLKL